MKKEKRENSIQAYSENSTLRKKNYFIGVKYAPSELEQKVTYLAMLEIQNKNYEEKPDGIYVEIPSAKIRKKTGCTSGSLYKRLIDVGASMTGNNMGIWNDDSEEFEFVTVINKASYSDGIFKIRFAPEMKENLVNIETKFTPLPEHIIMSFKYSYTRSLYELLKSTSWYPANYKGPRNNIFKSEYYVSELKLDLGVVNSNDPDVKKILRNGKGDRATYDKAVEKSPNKQYNRYSDFRERVIDRAVKEINEKSDIYVEYEPGDTGPGGKVYSLRFYTYIEGAKDNQSNQDSPTVTLNEEGIIETNLTDEEKFFFLTNVYSAMDPIKLGYSDVQEIAEKSNYNLELLTDIFDYIKNYRSPIGNVKGFILRAIEKGGYKKNQFVAETSMQERKSGFKNFHEREYDYDELMDEILNEK